MRHNREAILKENKEVGRTFRRAYRYLKAANSIYEDSAEIVGWCTDFARVNAVSELIIHDFFADKEIAQKEGYRRKLFASAITPNGLVHYLDTVLDTGKVYVVKGLPGTGTEKVLNKISDAAVERGFNIEEYYCALNPLKLEHLVIPALDVSITTSNEYHKVDIKPVCEINLDDCTDELQMYEYNDILEQNRSNFDSLLELTTKTIAQAKAIHDKMEDYYIPNMDFEAIQ
ncbi:MAG: ATPase, partial [Clostridiaceae bacterium]|nr:ATPase [Clostridiaceae bacterium]